jgi:hypothetical protein
MAKYMVFAPNQSEVTISVGYGSHIFRHGQVIENDQLALSFPDIFVRMADQTTMNPTLLTEAPVPVAKAKKLKADPLYTPEEVEELGKVPAPEPAPLGAPKPRSPKQIAAAKALGERSKAKAAAKLTEG